MSKRNAIVGNSFNSLFKNAKPVIGMIHLAALPGSPNHILPIEQIIKKAESDLENLVAGGVDAVLIENYHDTPFYPATVPPITIAAMTRIVSALRDKTILPIGVNILRNACSEAFVVAAVTEAAFIRCNFYTGVSVSDQGLIQGCAHQIKRLEKSLASLFTSLDEAKRVVRQKPPLIFADVQCKHSAPIVSRPLEVEALDALERAHADGIIISGERTGSAVEQSNLELLSAKNIGPLIIGSGLTKSNVSSLLSIADGAIIGSSLKRDGIITNPVDLTRVRELMKEVESIR